MWTLEGSKASFTCGPLLGCVRLGHLVSGVLGKTWDGHACDAFAILQLAIPLTEDGPRPELVDVYVRGGDLVATYARTPPLTVAPQIYWRLSFAERMQAVAIEVVLSMNTDLLESQPFSAINTVGFECNLFHSSELNAAQFKQLTSASNTSRFDARDSATHLFVLRNDSLKLSYAEMVFPDDFVAAEIDFRGEPYGTYRIHSQLFPEGLEKGVIRRGRICGWFMPAENDLENAVELARQFVDEPPPLTT